MLTRDQLLERVWGYTFAGDTRTVDVHVRQLRRKLGDASPIVTVWGVGYKVEPLAVEPSPVRVAAFLGLCHPDAGQEVAAEGFPTARHRPAVEVR